jgi:hypothetical protein
VGQALSSAGFAIHFNKAPCDPRLLRDASAGRDDLFIFWLMILGSSTKSRLSPNKNHGLNVLRRGVK